MMILSEYQVLAQRTASTKTAEAKRGHGSLGLLGEAGEIIDIVKKMEYMGMPKELARKKLVEEAGDMCWYIAEVCQGFNYCIHQFTCLLCPTNVEDQFPDGMEPYALRLIEYATRCALHKDDVPQHNVYLGEVALNLAIIMHQAGISLTEVLAHNIEKLRSRYPDGFSAERSNGRYA